MYMVKPNTLPGCTAASSLHSPVSYTDLTPPFVTILSSILPALHSALLIVHYGKESAAVPLAGATKLLASALHYVRWCSMPSNKRP